MGKAPNLGGKQHDQAPSYAWIIISTIGDTTWRMFVPIIGLLLVGRYIDAQTHLSPIYMAAGTVIGVCVSGVLIKNQLKKGR